MDLELLSYFCKISGNLACAAVSEAELLLLSGAGLFGSALPLQKASIAESFAPPVSRTVEGNSQNVGTALNGKFIFESNRRGGHWGIFCAAVGQSDIQPIAVSEREHCLYPYLSPNEDLLVYVRATDLGRRTPADIWIAKADGTNARMLVSNGTFPTFSSIGDTIYFERNRSQVMAVSLDGSNLRQIFPTAEIPLGTFELAKPRVASDESELYFISDRGGRWNSWGANLKTQQMFHIGRGCEPVPSADGKSVVWVTNRWSFGNTFLLMKDFDSNVVTPVGLTNRKSISEYFPSFSHCGRYLCFSAAQSSLFTRKATLAYQLYVRDMQSGQVTQITDDHYSYRWGKFIPRPQ